MVLKKAAEGELIHSGNIFPGGEREDALYYVSSIMGRVKEGDADSMLGELGSDSFRNLHLAYYKPDAVEPSLIMRLISRFRKTGSSASILSITAILPCARN